MTSLSGPVMVIWPAVSFGAGRRLRVSLPPMWTWRPVRLEASCSMRGRCELEATKPGSASTKVVAAAAAASGRNQR